MRLYRVYMPLDSNLPTGQELELDDVCFQHLIKVLRLTSGTPIQIVDGKGGHYNAILTQINKRNAFVNLKNYELATNESPLKLHLVQGISRGDKMELTIQKAVELGVTEITPIFTERCGVKLTGERLENKLEHWRKIIISACMQSFRDTFPVLNPAMDFKTYCKWQVEQENFAELHLVNLNPFAGKRLTDISQQTNNLVLLIGSEGGLSEAEIASAKEIGYSDYQLGPRVLRTETAGLTTIAILQSHLGDM